MIFLPSFLLVLGVMPYWNFFRNLNYIRNCLIGVNACVVGLLIAAFYDPIIFSTLIFKNDFSPIHVVKDGYLFIVYIHLDENLFRILEVNNVEISIEDNKC